MRTLALGNAVGAVATAPSTSTGSTTPADHPVLRRLAQPTLRPFRSPTRTLTVVAHRGASGYRPEHTLAAYQLAIEQGADVVEPDLVSTRDGVLVARHENEISGTTDVAEHPELADRRTTKVVDGRTVTGWFTEDLTLAELRTLRAVERLPALRPGNTLYDGRFQVPTFDEIIALVRSESRRKGRPIGIAPETKHPSHFASIGLDLTPALLRSLRRVGWDHARAPVLVQSFETTNLRQLAAQSAIPLLQLTATSGAPHDLVLAGEPTTYADLMTPEGLRAVRSYATWIGPAKDSVLPRDEHGRLTQASDLVDHAHRAGLKVMVYTVRAENRFLPLDHRIGAEPDLHGDVQGELLRLAAAGVDGVFVDQPDLGVAARRLVRRAGARPAARA